MFADMATPDSPVHIRDLKPDAQNRRRHSPRNIGMIADALQKVGAARSIVINARNEVLAGNGVLEAAAEVGITKVRTIDAAGDEIIAVRRAGLSEDQERDLAIFDNRAAELAEWDPEQLQADLDAGHDLSPFFTDKELKNIVSATDVMPVQVPQPTEVIWVLCAVPVHVWARHQAAIEQLQRDSEMSVMIARPSQPDDPFRAANEGA
jgi:hypothetical protein